jgi:hypothetical protein
MKQVVPVYLLEDIKGDRTMHGWVEEARKQHKLRITENNNCPFCNPEHRLDVPTNINACEKHFWASKRWFEGERKFINSK